MTTLEQVLKGAARTLDIGAVLTSYGTKTGQEQTDAEAIRSDWEQVGRDFYTVMAEHEQQ
jgi:hypothetical protein